MFTRRTDVKAEAPILWPPAVKSCLIWKDPDVGKGWRHEEKGMTEDEMVGWHHWFNGHELEQTLGDSEGQRSLLCCSPWGCKELDWLNEWTRQTTKDRCCRENMDLFRFAYEKVILYMKDYNIIIIL